MTAALHQIQREGYPARKIADTVFEQALHRSKQRNAGDHADRRGHIHQARSGFRQKAQERSYCAQNCTGSVARFLVFNSSEQIGNENSRNEKRKKRLVDCKNCKTRAAQTAHGKVGGAV